MITKFCPKCERDIDTELFPKNKSKKDGLDYACKECMKKYRDEYRALHYEEQLAKSRKWKRDHREECLAYNNLWNKANPERRKENDRRWAKENPEKVKEAQQKFYKNNPDKIRAWTRKTGAKLRSTPAGKLRRAMGSCICLCLQGQKAGKYWEPMVGYTIDDLRHHLESLFQPGMSWDNYGMGGWEMDHKTPVALFDFNNPEEIRKCWSLSNIQPLWGLENKKKGKKILHGKEQ